MIDKPMDVLQRFPIRKSKKQKTAFLKEAIDYFEKTGYRSTVEKGSFGCRNLVVGDPATAKYLITAHYDTCARLPFPNLLTPCNFLAFLGYQLFTVVYMLVFVFAFAVVTQLLTQNEGATFYVSYIAFWAFLLLMLVGPANKHNANDNTSGVVTVMEIATALPEQYRCDVCFVLFDLEEAGLIGSASYQNKHKAQTKNQIVLNLDCVGDGDEIVLFPNSRMKKNKIAMDVIRKVCGQAGNKTLSVKERGFAIYPSDQSNFPQGVGIAAFNKGWAGLYLSRIHTSKDTILDAENVIILRDRLLAIARDRAAQ